MVDIEHMHRLKLNDLTMELLLFVKGIRESLFDDDFNAQDTICGITDILKKYEIETEE